MKHKRWIAFLLIAGMTLTLICSCKTKEEEDFSAQVGEFVENEAPEEKEEEPSEKEEKEPEKEEPEREEEKQPSEEEKKEEPSTEEKEEEPTPSEEEKKEGKVPSEESDPDPAPVTKETSGTPITIMVQNLKTSGSQTADYQGQRTDTLGRTGQANELYSRARRFRENVKRVDPDVILGCEGKTGWVKWFEEEAYFKSNYTLVYNWVSGVKEGVDNDSCTLVLFKTDQYELLDSGIFWYAEDPTKPGSFVEGGKHGCTWAKLKDKTTDAEFYALAIHIPNNSYEGGDSGFKCMEVLNTFIDGLPAGSYAFAGGDYNIGYRDAVYEGSVEFDKMFDLKDQALNMKADGLSEIGGNKGSVNTDYEKDKYGGIYGTPPVVSDPGDTQKIDHLMAKPNVNLAIDYWGYDYTTVSIPAENVVEGYVSDHYALVAKVRIGTDADYSQYQERA